LPGGEANGLGNERPDTPFVKCGTAFTRKAPQKKATYVYHWPDGTDTLAVGYLLVCRVGEFHVRRIPDALVLGAGGLLMGIQLARWFGRAYVGQ
jgi:hypothetical protein